MKLLKHLTGEMSRGDLQDAIGLRDAEHFRKTYIHPVLESKALEMAIPEKPTSSKQQYRISAVGKL
jgi:ATP-dependent DNA helicase RecG